MEYGYIKKVSNFALGKQGTSTKSVVFRESAK